MRHEVDLVVNGVPVAIPGDVDLNHTTLSQFLRGDFSSIKAELAKVFPTTQGLQERYVPLVQRYAYELSGMYARPVVRRSERPQSVRVAALQVLQRHDGLFRSRVLCDHVLDPFSGKM